MSFIKLHLLPRNLPKFSQVQVQVSACDGFNLKTSVELYCERLTLEFTAIFAEFWLTVVVTTAFTKIQQKSLYIRRLSRSRYEFN